MFDVLVSFSDMCLKISNYNVKNCEMHNLAKLFHISHKLYRQSVVVLL